MGGRVVAGVVAGCRRRQRPLSTTTVSPGRRVWNTASPSPVRQIEIVSSSPGNTGEVNRASIDLKRAGSLSHSALSNASTGESVGAQTVEDRPVEAGGRGERRIGVQRVAVTRQPVDERLIDSGLVLHDVIGLALGRRRARTGRPAVATPATLAADERGRAGGEERLAGGGIDRLGLGRDHRAGTLVVDAGHRRHRADRALDGDRLVQLDGLLAVHEHRPVDLA